MTYDLIIRGGLIGTAEAVFSADLAVAEGRIAAIGDGLRGAKAEIDARNKLVLPGGVDSHCHIEQMSAAGVMTADDFESATTAAAFGGTTSVISFAAQIRGSNIETVVSDYATRAKRGAIVDYSFHMIVTDANAETLAGLSRLTTEGHRSIKAFMTYDRLRLDDDQLIAILRLAREAGAMVCVHAENNAMISWASKQLLDAGLSEPRHQPKSHPRLAEVEAFHRLIALSQLVDQPVTIFHVSTAEGAEIVRDARRHGAKITAETCPQYLFLTAADVDKPGLEAAKLCCSPALREKADQDALWDALARRDIEMVSSDHAPYACDETGKLRNGPASTFKEIANGLPGIETRQMLMFDAMVSKGRASVSDFVDLTSTTPARHYGLAPRKGSLTVGADADIVLWNPDRRHVISAGNLHDRTGYTPYEGYAVTGYPETVLRRGEIIVQNNSLTARPGSGRFIGQSARHELNYFV